MNSMTRSIIHPVATTVDGMARIGLDPFELRGIRFNENNGGNAGGQGGTGGENGGNAGGTDGAQNGGTGGDGGQNSGQNGQQGSENGQPAPGINPATGQPFTPTETAERISRLNREAQSHREARETAEAERDAATARANAILKAAGFNPDGTPYTEVTPEQVQQQVTSATSAAEAARRESLVVRVAAVPTATRGSINVDRLLDSRTFTERLASVRPDDRAGVEALVDEWVQKDPTLAAPLGSAASSSGGTTHQGTSNQNGRKSREAAIADRYKR